MVSLKVFSDDFHAVCYKLFWVNLIRFSLVNKA